MRVSLSVMIMLPIDDFHEMKNK